MNAKEIVLIRYRKSLRIGIFDAESGGKLKVAIEKGRTVSVPRANLLLEMGRQASGQGQLDACMREIEALAGELDIQELWELVSEDDVAFEASDLADLLFPAEPRALEMAALLWRLESDDCPFFEVEEGTYRPAQKDAVEEQQRRRERQQKEQEEERSLLDWIRGENSELSPEAMTTKQRVWFERIRDFVIEGEDGSQTSKVKTFLAQASLRGDLRRALFRLFVDKGIFEADEHLELVRFEVPTNFEAEVEVAAASYDPLTVTKEDGRRDLGELAVFSVDDATTTDIDDAFSMIATDSGYQLGIHITDLSLAVPPESTLDESAASRVTSHYFPERKLPMLPPELSEGKGSLLEGKARPTISALIDLDSENRVLGVEFTRAHIVNRHRLDYDQVDRITEENEDHPLADSIRALDSFAARRLEERVENGAVEIERSDISIRIGEEGEIDVELRPANSRAQRLVSELMILYNVEAAKFCHKNEVPVIFRAQGASRPDFSSYPGEIHPALKRNLYLRAAEPPDLTMEPKPHQMLGVELYCQISSPLRRYVDLLHQRQIANFLREGRAAHDTEAFRQIFFRTEERLRELRRLEGGRNRYWLLRYLKGLDQETFKAIVLDDGERQAQIEVLDYSLRAGMNLHRPVQPGEIVEAKLTQADPWEGTVRFALK